MLESFFKVSPLKIKFALVLGILVLLHLTPLLANADEELIPEASAEFRATGLELGNNLTHVTLKGHVKMQCNEYALTGPAEFDCTMDALEPFTSSRFQTALVYDADHFDMNVAHEKSWSRHKSGEYVPASGSSALSLNLWSASIFDWPILEDGLNVATYQLTKKGKVVTTGAFNVTVAHISRACQPKTIVSYDPNDCRSKSAACTRYFFDNNHCLSR